MHLTLRTALLATLACTPVAGRAADVTQAQAQALEDQVRGYYSALVGPEVMVKRSPLRVIPEGDHFSLSLPLDGSGPTVPALLGEARPLEGGRWALDHLRVTSPATFAGTMKVPARDASRDDPQSGKPATSVPVTYTLTYAGQDGSGTWDPTYATPSVISSNSHGFRLEATGPAIQQTSTLEHSAGTVTLRPTGGDQVDVVMDATGDGYAVVNKSPAAPAVLAQAQAMHISGEVTGVSRDHASAMVPALIRVGKLQQVGQAGVRTGDDNAAIDTLIQAMQGFASAVTLTETVDGLHVQSGDVNGTFAQVRLGVDAQASAGFLTGHMDLALDGLALAGLPLGPLQGLLPQRIALRPVVSHASTKDLLQLLRTAMENPQAGPPQPEIDALFSHGGLVAGLESFAFDVGGAAFTGTASIDVTSPQQASGTGQITVTGWDVLFTRVQNTPELAQGIPFMVFAKGMAKPVGDRLVWDLTFRDNKFLVNGTDLSGLTGRGQ